MGPIPHIRIRAAACLALLAAAVCAAAQSQNQNSAQTQNQGQSQKLEDQSRAGQKPMVLKPDLPGLHRNHRLILKDGSYQVVTQYQIVGNRVRYFSQERGDWEEMPESMVDWAATRKWEQDHNPIAGEENSPAMKEAAALDAEETAEREDQKARMPEVAKGLNLPDQDGVFALDTYRGTPELVALKQINVDPDARVRHGEAMLNPMTGAKRRLVLDGGHAKVHLHVDRPTFFISLDTPHAADSKEPVLSNPITVKTVSDTAVTDRKYGAHSPSSQFAIVYLDQRIAMRFLGPIQVSSTGAVIGNPIVIPTKVQVMPGGRWLRVEPLRSMLIGEYALVEILSPTEMNPSVWAFELNPATGDNPGSLAPILDSPDNQ